MDKVEETLKNIEMEEISWRYELTEAEDKQHSFGRVPEDKNVVAFWSVPRTTGEFLKFMVEFAKSKIILELGCSAGYSTLFLANATQSTNGHVYTTEILPEKIKIARKNFVDSSLQNNITLIEDNILNVLKRWDRTKKIDLVFLDADKEKYSTYLDLLLPLLSEKSMIIVDNAGKVRMADGSLIDSEHIKNFVQDVRSNKNLNSVMINMDNGLLLIKKK